MAPSTRFALLAGVAFGLAAAAPLGAQQILYDFAGFGGAHFGWHSDTLGDINGDNFPDLIAGAPEDNFFVPEAGRVIVFSGRDGSQLFELFGEHTLDHFGEYVSGPGDVNSDGIPDFLVGAPFGDGHAVDSGYAELRSGADASVLLRFDGDLPGDTFGDTVEAAGDTNADGRMDFIVGGRGSDGNGLDSGIARIYSGLDGSILRTFYGSGPGALFGSATDGVGDVNGDGHDDVIVGARGASVNGMSRAGMAVIYSGLDGSVLLEIDGRAAGDGLGKGASGLGDVNGDGTIDVAVGAWQVFNTTPSNRGYVLVIDGTDGHEIYQVTGDHPLDTMGTWVDGAGDANRDGYLDFAVGSARYDCFDVDTGQLRVFSGKDGSLIYLMCGLSGGDGLGHMVSLAGDVNQDGYDDLTAGSYWNDLVGHDAGATYVFSGCPAVLERVGTDLVGSNGLPPNLAGCGTLEGGARLTLRMINARPQALAALIVGLSQIDKPFKGGLLVPAPDVLIVLPTGLAGTIDIDHPWPQGVPSGFQTFYQFWINDPGAPTGWAASNALRAVTP